MGLVVELMWAYAAILIWFVVLLIYIILRAKDPLPPGACVALMLLAFGFGLLTWALTFPHYRP